MVEKVLMCCRTQREYIFETENALNLAYYSWTFTNRTPKKKKITKKLSKLLIIFLEIFRDSFVTAVEAAYQSPPGTRANLHKVEAAGEGLLLGESAEYTASQAHRPTPVPTTHASKPSPATRAKLRLSPKNIFLEINIVNNIIT
jgi:hypothetical protein